MILQKKTGLVNNGTARLNGWRPLLLDGTYIFFGWMSLMKKEANTELASFFIDQQLSGKQYARYSAFINATLPDLQTGQVSGASPSAVYPHTLQT